jgi:hypothetical protein
MRGKTPVRHKAVWGWRPGVLALVVAMVAGTSCGSLTKQGQGASYLTIDSLEGASGADPSATGNVLQSDVVTVVKGTPTFYSDPGSVVFRLGLKDPGSATSPASPTANNFITVTGYHVTFRRADGRNTPGVDVPYAFDGAISVTVVGGTVGAGFILVRAQAKMEAPLAALANGGGAKIISTIAEVTFYGHDQTGVPVSVTGQIGVDFADWGDPQT